MCIRDSLRRVYKEGSFVPQGELLFEIDPRQFEAQHQQAEANLEQAKAALAKADLDVSRAAPRGAGVVELLLADGPLDRQRLGAAPGLRSAPSRRPSRRHGSTCRGPASRPRFRASPESGT